MNYYIVTLRRSNFEIIQENEFNMIGFSNRSKIADKIVAGDRFIIYLSGKSVVVGELEAKGPCTWDNTLVFDDIYPKRVDMRQVCILKEDSWIKMKKIKNGLSFIDPQNEKYGVYFMNTPKCISEKDYKYLKRFIEEASSPKKK